MPSFRVQLEIGALSPGVTPDRVLPAAAAAAAEVAEVEASDLAVVSGAPRAVVRFAIDDPELAEQVAAQVVASTAALAQVRRWSLTRREHGRWVPARADRE
jgi:predicted outer membrane protein